MDFGTNGTGTGVATSIPSSSSPGGSPMKFREDGLREPPLFTESPNMIIMIVGLSILIVPVVCFLICICARTRLFETLRGLKFSSSKTSKDDVSSYCDGSNLPYSHFGSDDDDPKPKKTPTATSQDVRVLIQKDNFTIPGSPKINQDSKNNYKPENKVLVRPYAYDPTSSSGDDFNPVDADATFVVPGGERKSSLTTINLNS